MPKPVAATSRKLKSGSPKRWSGSSSKRVPKRALWTKAFPSQVKARRPAAAKRPSRRAVETAIYRKEVKKWIAGKECQCNGAYHYVDRAVIPCNVVPHPATECHHRFGRVGNLLLDQNGWLPVCHKAHLWIHRNIEIARKLFMIAQRGDWGRQ